MNLIAVSRVVVFSRCGFIPSWRLQDAWAWLFRRQVGHYANTRRTGLRRAASGFPVCSDVHRSRLVSVRPDGYRDGLVFPPREGNPGKHAFRTAVCAPL
ncbi:MAG: hypothetical protein A3A28_02255 [Candidatus Sungbacteria bacterium RIFCSPLOWO2_01_FULL_47_32]|uniref:Uncharacterized protein n=1 Tax=Candidatus Sungbacteria bacterium RIFCSPHIGHO2_01_FULL_47_32 TaxID=1802264 RepID=A0A1G2K7U1_9BACT|nr:MAG: hypothetical protein A2633_05935 [Candidatus Sungbacteria bacterium RIFCSPHIGHO2_01_FULL_47_32]OHA06291.1 MAG: hypothetical protein A3A28_02255 [Candidatus Sungbacteria bacterium RIFCSPLOWO2_01_FULL_47_32]